MIIKPFEDIFEKPYPTKKNSKILFIFTNLLNFNFSKYPN